MFLRFALTSLLKIDGQKVSHLRMKKNNYQHFLQYTIPKYIQYPLQEIQLQEPVLEFGEKLETTSAEILRLRDIKIAGNEFWK